jgi:subtilisin family serine protease
MWEVQVMRRYLAVLVALLAITAIVLVVPADAAGYSDAACATAPVTWTNDRCAGREWGLVNIEAPQAWTTSTGGGITVAVVDTGADFNHPDLAANLIARSGSNIIKNTAYVCPFQKPGPNAQNSTAIAQDDNGHGTHVSGTIAAVTGNGTGVAGAAPGARVLPVKVLDATGSGSDSDVARGICFAADNGAKVINLSLGFDPASSVLIQGLGSDTDDAIAYAFSKGVAVLIAAGNEGFPACDFPASLTQALCVGAVDRNDVKAYYSNFGANVGVVAPGGLGSVFCEDDEDIWSTILPSSDYDCDSNGYDSLAGTSMATPHAAAVAALIAARFGTLATPAFIYNKLTSSADDLGTPGADPLYGYGRVNAQRAVA